MFNEVSGVDGDTLDRRISKARCAPTLYEETLQAGSTPASLHFQRPPLWLIARRRAFQREFVVSQGAGPPFLAAICSLTHP